MKLKGELNEKVEKAESREQAKDILDKTGIELTDEELDNVVGGCSIPDQRPNSLPRPSIMQQK